MDGTIVTFEVALEAVSLATTVAFASTVALASTVTVAFTASVTLTVTLLTTSGVATASITMAAVAAEFSTQVASVDRLLVHSLKRRHRAPARLARLPL
jgi:hypothetical protein